jgi:hypothetical protein
MPPWRGSVLPLCAQENVRVWCYSPTWYQQARKADSQTKKDGPGNGQAVYLVDTADLETKRATFNTRSIHIIPNK